MMYYIVLPFGVILSLVFCWKRRLGYSVNNLIFKSVSSLCYLLTAVFALISNPQAHTYGSLVIMGGALGLVGDILLDLKGIYKDYQQGKMTVPVLKDVDFSMALTGVLWLFMLHFWL